MSKKLAKVSTKEKMLKSRLAGVKNYYNELIESEKITDFIRLSDLIMKNGDYIYGIVTPDGEILGFNVDKACKALGKDPNDTVQYRDAQSIISAALGKKIRSFNIPFGSVKHNGNRYYGIIFYKEDAEQTKKNSRRQIRGRLDTLIMCETNNDIKEVSVELQGLLDFGESL